MSLTSDTMNVSKGEIDNSDDQFDPAILDHGIESEPPSIDQTEPLTLPPMSEIVIFRDEDSVSHTSSDGDEIGHRRAEQNPRVHRPDYINPDLYISTQFYTFNPESHSLMIRCILEGRIAGANEICAVTSNSVLVGWRAVWKDRNEHTAFVTAWKRIQEKLVVVVDTQGNEYLCFKNNSNNQFVSHFNQWQDLVTSFHSDENLKHFSLKETIDRIKQVWTVGAKFYGIPEPFIRACISECPVCSDSSGLIQSNKRRKFEYTDSIELPAKDVPYRLQQLAAKHKAVLCIRQKYIRNNPIMAEVKDYVCHRAGDPVSSSKKSKTLTRESYGSKRCGCSFRIRAIVPIANYNEKDKSFVYQEEGIAIFKLFAVHSGHEPGPLDGHTRIIHRVVGLNEGLLADPDCQDTVLGINNGGLLLDVHEEAVDMRGLVSQQVQELKNILGSLESSISMIPDSFLSFASRDLSDIMNKLRRVGEYHSENVFEPLVPDHLHMHQHQHQSDDMMIGEDELVVWDGHHPHELIEDGEDNFSRTLVDVVGWDEMRVGKDVGLLNCEESKLRKPVVVGENENENVESDGIIHADNFYQDNDKWYDSTCVMDSEVDCGDSRLRD